MTAEMSRRERSAKPFGFEWHLAIAWIILGIVSCIVGLAGAWALAGFWGIWRLIVGAIPDVMGISRLWLDSAGFFFYANIIMRYAFAAGDAREGIAENRGTMAEEVGLPPVSIWEAISSCPNLKLTGASLIISLVAGIFLSFAVGLVIFIALRLFVWLYLSLFFAWNDPEW